MNSPFMDDFMFWAADKFIWIPLYIFLAIFLVKKFGLSSLYMILFVVLLIVSSDQISVLIKNSFERLRPCHDESLSFLVHTVRNKCGGKFGFVSSHAANTMALFVYLLLLTRNSNRWITGITAAFVMLVSYSRIYMGVHFPADIIGGWIVGIFAAGFTYLIYRLMFDSP
ncbi:MAG: phosphatase PAP2 family protein [Bacteroidetes bacterium]|nr:phosphatase PAP2 family protein [Bacteroidota bacterium]